MAVKVSDRIAKMTGLDAAQRVELLQLDHVNDEIAKVQREIEERRRAIENVIEGEIVD